MVHPTWLIGSSGWSGPRVRMILAAATATRWVPLRPSALYASVMLRLSVDAWSPRSEPQSRMRKFDWTQALRPAGIGTGVVFRALHDRSPGSPTASPFGGGEARRTWTATRSITAAKRCGPPPPSTVIVRLVRFVTVMSTARRRPRIHPICIPVGVDEPSPHRPLVGPAATPPPRANGAPSACVDAPQPLPTMTPIVIAKGPWSTHDSYGARRLCAMS